MTTKNSTRAAAGAAVAALAIVGLTACGGPSVPSLPSNLPQIPGVGDPRAAFGNAHQSALGLAALGGLGTAQGVGQQVKDLAPQLQSEGQSIDQKLRGLAGAIGVSLPDQVGPEVQAQLDDLKARTGAQFDQGWLQAAQAEQTKLKEQATALLNVPGVPEDQKNQLRQQLDGLDQLGQKLAAAVAGGGAATPGEGGQAAGEPGTPGQENGGGAGGGSGAGGGNGGGSGSGDNGSGGKGDPAVDAGTGGQAAQSGDPVLPFVFGGAGLALIAAAGVWLRRSRA